MKRSELKLKDPGEGGHLDIFWMSMCNKKRATCLATLLQNELNSDVAPFTTNIKPVLQQIEKSGC